MRRRGPSDGEMMTYVLRRADAVAQFLIGEIGVRHSNISSAARTQPHPACAARVNIAMRAHQVVRFDGGADERPRRSGQIVKNRFDFRAVGVGMMKAPAAEFVRIQLKSSSAACIFTSLSLKRKAIRRCRWCGPTPGAARAFDASRSFYLGGDHGHGRLEHPSYRSPEPA